MVVIKTVNLKDLNEIEEEKAKDEGNVLHKVCRNVHHDNIIKLYCSHLLDNEAIIILEYIEGGDLRGKIEEEKLYRKKFDEKQFLHG